MLAASSQKRRKCRLLAGLLPNSQYFGRCLYCWRRFSREPPATLWGHGSKDRLAFFERRMAIEAQLIAVCTTF